MTALIIDDLISTGGTLVRAARAARNAGARRVLAFVTHGLFMPGAEAAIMDPAIDRIVATDSVPSFRLSAAAARAKVDALGVAPVFADCIRRLHAGETLTDLLVF
jgi:ribose-phosphate pyrophosphokinase